MAHCGTILSLPTVIFKEGVRTAICAFLAVRQCLGRSKFRDPVKRRGPAAFWRCNHGRYEPLALVELVRLGKAKDVMVVILSIHEPLPCGGRGVSGSEGYDRSFGVPWHGPAEDRGLL